VRGGWTLESRVSAAQSAGEAANRGELPDVAAAAEEAIEEVRALIGEIGQMQSK
jgi:hypothetical protein